MRNQTIVALPARFDEFKQVRTFAVKLIEQLDRVLGYRGDNPYVTEEELSSAADATGLTLAELIVELRQTVDQLLSQDQLLADAVALAEGRLDTIQAGTALADDVYAGGTASATYSQTELQDTMDALLALSASHNNLLAILRTAEIIS